MTIHEEFEPFKKDFKKLNKKYRSLSVDFERFKTALETDGINLTGVVLIPMGDKCSLKIYKARKFRCQSLEGKGNRSGIRVIFSAEKTCIDNSDRWDYHLEPIPVGCLASSGRNPFDCDIGSDRGIAPRGMSLPRSSQRGFRRC